MILEGINFAAVHAAQDNHPSAKLKFYLATTFCASHFTNINENMSKLEIQ
jgi:hypothetical protein